MAARFQRLVDAWQRAAGTCQGRLGGSRTHALYRGRYPECGARHRASRGTGRRAPHRLAGAAGNTGTRPGGAGLRARPLRSRAPSLVCGSAHRHRRHGPVHDPGLRPDGRAGANRHGARLRGALHRRRTLSVASPRLDDARRTDDRHRRRHDAACGLRHPGRDRMVGRRQSRALPGLLRLGEKRAGCRWKSRPSSPASWRCASTPSRSSSPSSRSRCGSCPWT